MYWSRTPTLAFLGLLAALPTLAQPAAEISPRAVSKLVVTVGKTLLLDSPVKITRLAAANSDLIESIAIGPREVLINGKLAGETSLVVWLDNQTRLTYDLIVRASPQRLNAVREQVARDLPGGNVDITLDNDTAFVRGRVKDMFSADRVMAIAATLGKTVNLLRVDVPPVEPQILLHVKFASVDRSASSDLGVDLASTAFNQTTALGTGQLMSQTGGPPFSLSQAVNLFLFRKDLNLAAAIHALEAKRQLQLLAEPNLMVINNTPARFVAGGEYPIPIVQPGGGSNSVTIAFKEYGIKLGFLPYVTPRGTIRLQVAPEVSAIDYANSVTVAGTTVPGTTTRKVQTEVELDSGQSFVIAGLLDNRTTEVLSRIPGISNIPLLGKLFQSKTVSKTNTELLVIVTPELVRPLPEGEPGPVLPFSSPFLPPSGTEQLRQPGIDKTGLVPLHPPSESMPVEQLMQIQKGSPAGSGSTAPQGRLTGELNGRFGAEPTVVATYRLRENPQASDLILPGRTLRRNGRESAGSGKGTAYERIVPELTGGAFPVVEDQLRSVPHVRLTTDGRLVQLPEQGLDVSPRLVLVLQGLIVLVALCLSVLSALVLGLVSILHGLRTGLSPDNRLSGLRGRSFGLCQVVVSLAPLLVAASVVLASRGATNTGISSRPRDLDIVLDPPRGGYSTSQTLPFFQTVRHRVNLPPSAIPLEVVPIGVKHTGRAVSSPNGADSDMEQLVQQYLLKE